MRPLTRAHAEVPTTTLIVYPIGGGSLTFGGPGGPKLHGGSPNLVRMFVVSRAPYIRSPPCTAKNKLFWGDTLAPVLSLYDL